MEADDAFGHDPQVIYLRHVFSTCESMQKELLAKLNISEIDVRLRKVRRIALDYFERLLPLAMRKGIVGSEEDAGTLYLHCLSKALVMNNIRVSPDVLPPNDRISVVLKEVIG
ncbi:MAG TPA: hypothetical protein VHO84_01180 [Syntrophorhabdaceae bacterium]|nr:hypothetical protein [Syntrophorhabdaceae bacterium]